MQQGLAPATTEDETVLPLAGNRSADAEFEAFVRESSTRLLTVAYLLVGDQHRAEELVQQAYERVWRAWSRVRHEDPWRYTRRVLMNLRVDHWRRRRREHLVAAVPDPGEAARDQQVVERDELVRALMLLPAKQRRVVVMRHLLDMSVEQVCAELGVTPGTVKASSSRGLATLRAALAPEGSAR